MPIGFERLAQRRRVLPHQRFQRHHRYEGSGQRWHGPSRSPQPATPSTYLKSPKSRPVHSGAGTNPGRSRRLPDPPWGLVGLRFGPPHPGQRTVPGLEATGVVVAAGPGVDNPTVGTRNSARGSETVGHWTLVSAVAREGTRTPFRLARRPVRRAPWRAEATRCPSRRRRGHRAASLRTPLVATPCLPGWRRRSS